MAKLIRKPCAAQECTVLCHKNCHIALFFICTELGPNKFLKLIREYNRPINDIKYNNASMIDLSVKPKVVILKAVALYKIIFNLQNTNTYTDTFRSR